MKRTKVKNLAKQIRGVSYKPEDLHDSLDEDSVILLRANNIDEGKINFDDVVYVDKSKVSDEQYLKVGDVLICASSGSKQLVGKAASVVFDSPCTFGAFCKVVRPNNNVADYLGKYFQSGVYRRKISEVAIGANINNIRNEHIDSLELPIYEPAQAQRIVEKIGLLQNIIDNRKYELSKLDELIKARFVELFGDPESAEKYPQIAIKDFTDVISGGTPDRKNNQYWENGTVPWVKTTELQNNRINSVEECITEKGLNESSAKVVPENTVLIAMYGQGKTRGMTAILGIPASTNQACACILPCETVVPKYLWQYMIMSYDRLRNLAQGGNQPNLNGNMIKNFTVLVPPVELQMQFVKFVEQVDKLKVAVQAALDKAQLLFDSLMQEYFG